MKVTTNSNQNTKFKKNDIVILRVNITESGLPYTWIGHKVKIVDFRIENKTVIYTVKKMDEKNKSLWEVTEDEIEFEPQQVLTNKLKMID